jgi:hypothetical protein
MLSGAVAARAGPLDHARLLQIAKPIVDPGFLPPGRYHHLGDGKPGRAGVGEHGQQPGHVWVAVARLGRRPAARPGLDRVAVAGSCGRERHVAARAGMGGGVAGGRLGGDGVQPGGGGAWWAGSWWVWGVVARYPRAGRGLSRPWLRARR